MLAFIDAKSNDVPVDERLRLLREIFDSNHPLRGSAGRHLGYALRTQCRWDDALAVFDELALLDPDPVHVNQRSTTLSLARRFADARDARATTPGATDRVTRAAEYAHGQPDRYFQEVVDKLAGLRAQGRQREWLDDQGDLLGRRALFRSDVKAGEISDFLDEAELSGSVVAIKSGLQAAILSQEGTADERAVTLQRLRAMDLGTAHRDRIGFRFAMAELCDALVAGDRPRLLELSGEVATVEKRSRSWIPAECFLEAVGLRLPPMPTQWLDPYPTVLNRWTAHLDHYLDHHGARRSDVER